MILRLLKKFALLVGFFAATAGILLFQNCSDVRITPKALPSQPPPEKKLVNPVAKMCPPTGVSFGAPIRIVFIVDMSMSNVGVLATENYDNYSVYRIETSAGPSDLKGDRFTQIREFIDKCGGSANVTYSVIGFSDQTHFTHGETCLSPFLNQQEALNSIDGLKTIQETDLKTGSGINKNPFVMGGSTFYSNALDCLKNKMLENINLLKNEKPVYDVFFVTDGQPTDTYLKYDYKQPLKDIGLAAGEASATFNFYPLYYTSAGAKNQGQQQTEALATLTDMAAAVNPGSSAQLISNLSTIKDSLCQSVKPQATLNYSLKKTLAVNITAKMQKNILMADSDMDGVPDDIEKALGWDSVNSHSTGILDGLCQRLGSDKTQCAGIKKQITCDASISLGLGLNQCDIKVGHKIWGGILTGIDSDQDLIPDFIEITRDTLPLKNDSLDNPGGDGLGNIEKISAGLDINSNMNQYVALPAQLMNGTLTSQKATCGTAEQIELNQPPLVPTLAYTDSAPGPVNLTHGKNENVILVFYIWQANEGAHLAQKLYVQKITIPMSEVSPKIDEPIFLGEF